MECRCFLSDELLVQLGSVLRSFLRKGTSIRFIGLSQIGVGAKQLEVGIATMNPMFGFGLAELDPRWGIDATDSHIGCVG